MIVLFGEAKELDDRATLLAAAALAQRISYNHADSQDYRERKAVDFAEKHAAEIRLEADTLSGQHVCKTWMPFHQELIDEIKTFEIRRNDRNYKVGNIFVSKEWDASKGEFTGRVAWFTIKYVTDAKGMGLLVRDVVALGLSKPTVVS